MYLRTSRKNAARVAPTWHMTEQQNRRRMMEFPGTVMLMLIMMVIRGGPLSCKANFVPLAATEKGEWAFPHSVCKWKKSCRVDVYSYKRDQFADAVETFGEKSGPLPSSPSLFPNGEPCWRVCDNNYSRHLASRSYLQMYWLWLLWGPWSCWVYFDTSGRGPVWS